MKEFQPILQQCVLGKHLARLIEPMKRGHFRLTEARKKDITAKNLTSINNEFLTQYDSFQSFISQENEDVQTTIDEKLVEDSPLERIDVTVDQMNAKLWEDLLLKMGYGGTFENAGTVLGKEGDESVDGIICEDNLGFEYIYIQAKNWDINQSVGQPEIQQFVGSLASKGANKSLFITTAKYSSVAMEYSKKLHSMCIVLVYGEELTNLMIEHGLGAEEKTIYKIKEIDMGDFNS